MLSSFKCIFEAEHRYPEILFPLYCRGQNISPKLWIHLQTVLKATGSPFHMAVLTIFPRGQTLCILPALHLFCNVFCTASSLSSLAFNMYLFWHLCAAHVTGSVSRSEHHSSHSRLAVLLHILVRILIHFPKSEFYMLTLVI